MLDGCARSASLGRFDGWFCFFDTLRWSCLVRCYNTVEGARLLVAVDSYRRKTCVGASDIFASACVLVELSGA